MSKRKKMYVCSSLCHLQQMFHIYTAKIGTPLNSYYNQLFLFFLDIYRSSWIVSDVLKNKLEVHKLILFNSMKILFFAYLSKGHHPNPYKTLARI